MSALNRKIKEILAKGKQPSRTAAEVEELIRERERAAAEKAWDLAWTELRGIPRWWNPGEQRGGFDIQPMGLGAALEEGAYMEVRRVMLDNPFRAE